VIPSARAFALLGLASLLVVFAFVEPALGWAALLFDLVILGLIVVDGRRAGATPLTLSRALPPVFHQGEATEVVLTLATTADRSPAVHLREIWSPLLRVDPLDVETEVPAGGSRIVRVSTLPRLRGRDRLAPAALRVKGPWGLAWHTRDLDLPDDQTVFKVYPRLHLERRASLLLRRALRARIGANPVSARGLSTELYALREYRAGDSLRTLHWKASARLNRPITRELAWEQHQHTLVLIDCGRPMAGLAAHGWETDLSKLDHTMSAVVALLRAVIAQRDSATVVLFSKDVRAWARVDRRTRSFRPLFEQLHEVRADLDEPDYDRVAAWCAQRVPRRSLALLCTSVIDLGVAQALSRALTALSRRHLPLLVDLVDPDLDAAARSVPDDVQGAFKKTTALALMEHNESLGRRLRAQGIDRVSAPADQLAFGMLQRFLDLKARRRA